MFTWALNPNKILKLCSISCRNVCILAYFIFIRFPMVPKSCCLVSSLISNYVAKFKLTSIICTYDMIYKIKNTLVL